MSTQTPGILEALLAAIVADTASRDRNNELLERVVAGQAAAIEKIEAPKTPRKKAEPAAATEQQAADQAPPAAETTQAAAAEQQAPVETEVTDEDVKNAALAWMAKEDPAGAADPSKKDAAKRGECAKKLMEIVASFGLGGKLTGPESQLDAEQRKQALFFIRRWSAGLEVNFSADYDFDGDPTQGAAAAEEDPLG